MVNNQKFYAIVFCQFFYLILSFKLSSFDKVLSHFLVFCKPLPNLHNLLILILYNLNAFLALHTSNLSYYILAKIEAINITIAAILSAFEKKIFEIKNKYLRHYTQILTKNLDPLGETYLRKYKLTSNALIIQSCELVCIIRNLFSNFLFTN